ncbi:MAG: hypothetical protein IKN72_10575 [Clostridia bacterium]|nr:hypothetical protein [Clostridia bacterium]
MKEFKEGVTAPPFHPWCRCTTVPYFDDMKGIGERWMRDPETGKGGTVPSDMTYQEWKAKYVDKIDESGIIVDKDEFVPCLRDMKTGKLVDTEVVKVNNRSLLKDCTEKNGWAFSWPDVSSDYEVFALCVKGSNEIQGLIALQDMPNSSAIYLALGNAAPHNLSSGTNHKRYGGVGGHLFAIAAEQSINRGYGGFIYGDAATKELFDYFVRDFNATPMSTHDRPYRFAFEGKALLNILNTYNYDWRS